MDDPTTIIDRRNPCKRSVSGECDAILRIERDELRLIVSEGIERWLDRKFQQFGKWSLRALGAAAFGYLAHGVLTGDWRILP